MITIKAYALKPDAWSLQAWSLELRKAGVRRGMQGAREESREGGVNKEGSNVQRSYEYTLDNIWYLTVRNTQDSAQHTRHQTIHTTQRMQHVTHMHAHASHTLSTQHIRTHTGVTHGGHPDAHREARLRLHTHTHNTPSAHARASSSRIRWAWRPNT